MNSCAASTCKSVFHRGGPRLYMRESAPAIFSESFNVKIFVLGGIEVLANKSAK